MQPYGDCLRFAKKNGIAEIIDILRIDFQEEMIYTKADVIKEWEKATKSFEKIAEKVSIVRIGLVLSRNGGVLKQTMQPMSFGFGVYFLMVCQFEMCHPAQLVRGEAKGVSGA